MTSHCLECSASLRADARYCAQCGQRTDTARLTFRDVAHGLGHALFHVDHSLFSLLRALLVAPGRVALEYVRGARRRYFGPFGFVIVVVGVTTLLMALLGFEIVTSSSPQQGVIHYLQKHPNLILLGQVPLLALICRALFFEQKTNVAENLVLASYTIGIKAAVIGFLALPVWYFFRESPAAAPLSVGFVVAWVLYFGFAASGFYQGSRIFSFLRGACAALLAQFGAIGALKGAISLLARWGR